jgi:alpha-tubulin suppressor-like RCC1 family protein
MGYDDTTSRGDGSAAPYDMASLPAVNLGQGVKELRGVGYNTCALLMDSSVKCWGENSWGQLGSDDTTNRGDGSAAPYDMASLVSINLGQTAKSIIAGYGHNCALLADNSMKCWGSNANGQLGYDDRIDRGATNSAPYNMAALLNIDLTPRIKSMAAGDTHTCAILADNSIKCWGRNNDGQLGYDDLVDRGDGSMPLISTLPPINYTP